MGVEVPDAVEQNTAVESRHLPAGREIGGPRDRTDLRDGTREAERLEDRLRLLRPRAYRPVGIREVELVEAERLPEIVRRPLDFDSLLLDGEPAEREVLLAVNANLQPRVLASTHVVRRQVQLFHEFAFVAERPGEDLSEH